MQMSEQNDALTSATISLEDKVADGSGHHKISVKGIEDQSDIDRLARILSGKPGVIAVKVFVTGEVQFDTEFHVEAPVFENAVAQSGLELA